MGWLSNYCGLGGEGDVKHKVDWICKMHDQDYQAMTDAGENPYWTYNKADKKMMKRLSKIKDPTLQEKVIKMTAQGVWKLKQKITGAKSEWKEQGMNALRGIEQAVKNKKRERGEDVEEEGPSKWQRYDDEDEEDEEDWDDVEEEQDNGLKRLYEEQQAQPKEFASIEDKRTYVDSPTMRSESNLPQGTTMDYNMGECSGTGGAGTMNSGGGEMSVVPPKNVWHGFPNTQNALLKWRDTQFIDRTTNAEGTATAIGSEQQFEIFGDQSGITTSGPTNLVGAGAPSAHSMLNENITGLYGNTATMTGYDFSNPFLIQLRMTSPYNILKTFGTTIAQNETVGNAQPTWLEMFDSKYTYYNVLENEWKIHLNFGSTVFTTGADTTHGQDVGLFIFWRYTNEDDPPLNWTYNTTSTTYDAIASRTTGYITGQNDANMTGGPYTINCTPDDYMRMGHWNSKHVVLNSTKPTSCTIGGKYKFGQCKMDIKTISTSDRAGNSVAAEEWAQTGNVPVFPENLSVIILYDNAYIPSKMNGSTAGQLLSASARMETNQMIQFKDLALPYKFPTPGYVQAGSVTQYNGDIKYFQRGAAFG